MGKSSFLYTSAEARPGMGNCDDGEGYYSSTLTPVGHNAYQQLSPMLFRNTLLHHSMYSDTKNLLVPNNLPSWPPNCGMNSPGFS